MSEIKRVNFDLTKEDHIEIKRRAVIRNITMKDWIMMAIWKQIKEEQKAE